MTKRSTAGRPAAVVVIDGTDRNFDWRNLYAFRELLFVFAWRDIAVRYKQALLGVAWVILRPLIIIFVFTFVFGNLAKVPSVGDVPYVLVVCTGLLPWYLISLSLNDMAASLVSNSAIVTKVYFPRLILLISALVVNLVDFVASLLILLCLVIWFEVMPAWQIVFLPLVIVLAMLVVAGPGLLFAALNVQFRDFRYIVPFITQIGLYISPVAFSVAIVPEKWRLLYSLNPAVGVIESRWVILESSRRFTGRPL